MGAAPFDRLIGKIKERACTKACTIACIHFSRSEVQNGAFCLNTKLDPDVYIHKFNNLYFPTLNLKEWNKKLVLTSVSERKEKYQGII